MRCVATMGRRRTLGRSAVLRPLPQLRLAQRWRELRSSRAPSVQPMAQHPAQTRPLESEADMAIDRAKILEKVVERLSKVTFPNLTPPITEETEVYGDLGIYGDEMAELVWWLSKEFDVKGTVD